MPGFGSAVGRRDGLGYRCPADGAAACALGRCARGRLRCMALQRAPALAACSARVKKKYVESGCGKAGGWEAFTTQNWLRT